MPTIDIHATESTAMHLAGLIEDWVTRSRGEYDPRLDDLEREFAELRCRFGPA